MQAATYLWAVAAEWPALVAWAARPVLVAWAARPALVAWAARLTLLRESEQPDG
jgi:hypothetical protein